MLGGGSSLPAGDTVTIAGAATYTWTTSSTDPRALQAPGGGGRIAAAWYSASSFTVAVNLGDNQSHGLELYLLDWDSKGRSEKVQISDAQTGAVLATASASSFQGGTYPDFTGSGNVLDRRSTDEGGANAGRSSTGLSQLARRWHRLPPPLTRPPPSSRRIRRRRGAGWGPTGPRAMTLSRARLAFPRAT